MLSTVKIDAWIDVFNCRTGITTPTWWNSKCPLGTGHSQGPLDFTLGKVIWRIQRHFWSGFRWGLKDRREVTFGAFGPKSAGGAMNLKFSCIDGAGHCQLHLMVEADYDRRDAAERVEMLCAFEPAALDRFVEQMRELNSSLTGSAVLALL